MHYKVNVHNSYGKTTLLADKGANLLDLLRKNGFSVTSDCGGHGTCGKCGVRVRGLPDAAGDDEIMFLGEEKVKRGFRLSCIAAVNSDIDVYIDEAARDARILTVGKRRDIACDPVVKKRICNNSTEVSFCGKPICVEKGNTADMLYGTAVDIGTTTVAAYLYDLISFRCVSTASMLNPQRKYGADVISRISYSTRSDKNRREMQQEIIGCINELTDRLAKDASISPEHIYASAFAGNTTMLHFLTGLDASGIGAAPYVPAETSLQFVNAKDLQLNINPSGAGIVFPSVSAYVGGDTIACVSASGMAESEDISLLVDIGTNGEMVLGSRSWLISCSTAAGPAFEGANITWGIGGVEGAIDTVGPGPEFKCTTVGNTEAVGICGSGIVDAVSRLLDAGIIDRTGRMNIDGKKEFVLKPSKITISQKDIREIQNAKAAIAAGIEILIKESGVRISDIKKVYLAGAFASRLNIESAVNIGLLPAELKDRIETVGNAAGAGAAEALLSVKVLEGLEKLRDRIKYIELSSYSGFTDIYIKNLAF